MLRCDDLMAFRVRMGVNRRDPEAVSTLPIHPSKRTWAELLDNPPDAKAGLPTDQWDLGDPASPLRNINFPAHYPRAQ